MSFWPKAESPFTKLPPVTASRDGTQQTIYLIAEQQKCSGPFKPKLCFKVFHDELKKKWLADPLILAKSTSIKSQMKAFLFAIITPEIKQEVLQSQKLLEAKNFLCKTVQYYCCAWLKAFSFFGGGRVQCQNSLTVSSAALKSKSGSAFSVGKVNDIIERVNIPRKYRLSEFDLQDYLPITKSNLMNINPVSRLKKDQKCCKLDFSILNI